ncbi:MAG: hypothetical protein RL060_38 [Bacteroidota bacterium]
MCIPQTYVLVWSWGLKFILPKNTSQFYQAVVGEKKHRRRKRSYLNDAINVVLYIQYFFNRVFYFVKRLFVNVSDFS